MEQLITNLANDILSRTTKVHVLHNGVELPINHITLFGDGDAKRVVEATNHAERILNDVKRLKLL
jgi:hypothetical protein